MEMTARNSVSCDLLPDIDKGLRRFNESVTPAAISLIDAEGKTRDDVSFRADGQSILFVGQVAGGQPGAGMRHAIWKAERQEPGKYWWQNKSFTLSKLYATQAHGALVVRYVAVGTGIVNGKPYTPGPAPRLSVFSWSGTRWQLAAHANFNPLTG